MYVKQLVVIFIENQKVQGTILDLGWEECLESYICRDTDVLTRKRVGKHEGMKELY